MAAEDSNSDWDSMSEAAAPPPALTVLAQQENPVSPRKAEIGI